MKRSWKITVTQPVSKTYKFIGTLQEVLEELRKYPEASCTPL